VQALDSVRQVAQRLLRLHPLRDDDSLQLAARSRIPPCPNASTGATTILPRLSGMATESRVFVAWKGETAVTAVLNKAALLKSRDLLKKLSRIWLCASMDGAIHRKIPAVQGV